MRSFIITILTTLALVTSVYGNDAKTQVWEVLEQYGNINGPRLQRAVNDAIAYRKINPDITIILNLAKGKYKLNKQVTFKNMNTHGKGWLIIRGQGIGVTELVDTEYITAGIMTFGAIAPHRLKFSDFSLTGSRLTSSQGTVVAIGQRHVDIKLDSGFPVPTALFDTESTKANKLRLIDDSDPNNPHYVEGPNNDHYYYRIPWFGPDRGKAPEKLHDRVWRFHTKKVPPYNTGDRIAISSKSRRSNWGLFKGGGSDIIFENIALKHLGRIIFRQEKASWKNIRFTNISITRSKVNGITEFYSTDAGIQLGLQDRGEKISNLIVENCDIRGTVDDGLGLQNVLSGRISHNRWEDTGGVHAGATCGSQLIFSDNIYYHSPLEDLRIGGGDYKGAYKFSSSSSKESAVLQWKPGSRAQGHDIYFGSSNPPPFVTRQKELTYSTGKLEHGTTYYWKVNEYHQSFGIVEGDIQSFIF